MLDENGGDKQRLRVVNRSAVSMFGNRAYNTIIEPVFQAESHLYQNLQCADWICAILTRIFAYKVEPVQYPELKWTEEHGYDAAIFKNCTSSSMK